MSPEQASGEGAGPASDVYSLGPHPLRALGRIQPGHPAQPRRDRPGDRRAGREPRRGAPGAPAGLCAAIDACLEPDPDDRPGSRRPPRCAGGDPRRAPSRSRGPGAGRGARRGDAATRGPGATARDPPRARRRRAARIARRPAGTGDRRRGAARTCRARPRPGPRLAAAGARPGARPDRRRPAFLAVAARRERAAERAALAGLAWAWTAIAGGLLGRALGVPVGAGDVGGWASSGPIAIDGMIAPLLSPDGDRDRADLDRRRDPARRCSSTSPRRPAPPSAGLIWAGAIAALLGAAGDGAAPTLLLAPALIAASPGRSGTAPAGPTAADRPAGARRNRRRRDGSLRETATANRDPHPEGRIVRQPRNPAALPPRRRADPCDADGDQARAAALHGAGSRAGLP